jgi:hypothetical protein
MNATTSLENLNVTVGKRIAELRAQEEKLNKRSGKGNSEQKLIETKARLCEAISLRAEINNSLSQRS